MNVPTTPVQVLDAVAQLNKNLEQQLATASHEMVKNTFAVARASLKMTRENLERAPDVQLPGVAGITKAADALPTVEAKKMAADAATILAQWQETFTQSLLASRQATLKALNDFETTLSENEKQARQAIDTATTMVRESTERAFQAARAVAAPVTPPQA
jgi:hypothetical protein